MSKASGLLACILLAVAATVNAGETTEPRVTPGGTEEDPHCSAWVKWYGSQVYQGAGGTTRTIDGVEFWAAGRPERKNTQVGYLIFFLPSNPMTSKCLDKPRESDAARVARQVQGDAVIPLGRIGSKREFRIIKYLPADSVDTTPVTDEKVAADFDNFSAAREAGPGIMARPMVIDTAPPTAQYYPLEARRGHVQGTATIKVCADAEGKVDKPVEIVNSSGSPTLDTAATQYGAAITFKPQTIDGKPTPGCRNIGVAFK